MTAETHPDNRRIANDFRRIARVSAMELLLPFSGGLI
jgi:hypothetical protein